ncbi:MAG: ankyrin repeat domain-containing protein, partial [Candidatus Heimdallarchaeota archaeon]
DVVKYLVEQGADIHAKDDYALRWSAAYGHIDVVKYLVEHGADIHAEDDHAIQLSAENGNLKIVKYLVEHGADIHAEDDYALRWSVENGHIDVVKYLSLSINNGQLDFNRNNYAEHYEFSALFNSLKDEGNKEKIRLWLENLKDWKIKLDDENKNGVSHYFEDDLISTIKKLEELSNEDS